MMSSQWLPLHLLAPPFPPKLWDVANEGLAVVDINEVQSQRLLLECSIIFIWSPLYLQGSLMELQVFKGRLVKY